MSDLTSDAKFQSFLIGNAVFHFWQIHHQCFQIPSRLIYNEILNLIQKTTITQFLCIYPKYTSLSPYDIFVIQACKNSELASNFVESDRSFRFRRVRHIFVPLSPEVRVLRGHLLPDVRHLEGPTKVVEVGNRPNQTFIYQNRIKMAQLMAQMECQIRSMVFFRVKS